MNVAVLDFSYAGFSHFGQSLAEAGFYTSNLGDNAQTVAARGLFERLGFAANEIGTVDRDALPTYSGPPTMLLMNGVFLARTLPAPPQVTPIFLGFMAHEDAITPHLDWFRKHAPIGCRDPNTATIFMAYGIEAFVTGCVTLTLPRRAVEVATDRFFVVQGEHVGALPSQVLKHVPAALLDTAEFISHRMPESEYPLSPERRRFNERYETALMQRFRYEASLVLTPLLHVASPCVAMGVPVVLCRHDDDSRFGHLKTLIPLHTRETITSIDWSPETVDVSACAGLYEDHLRRLTGRT